jgi:DNA-directed RNA polymerase subunit RPC12/RpoP
MDIEDQFSLDHLIFTERKCRTCGVTKELINDFYKTRKNRTTPSAYSYECKDCTKKRVLKHRKTDTQRWEYPDW